MKKNLTMLVCVALLAACGTSPKVSFYTLRATVTASAERQEPATEYAVIVGPASVPDLVDRPQIVTRTGDNQVTISETARWAESPKYEIPRVVADDLQPQLKGAHVYVYPQGPANGAINVVLDVQSFDSVLGNSVGVDVVWTLRPPQGVALTGRSVILEGVSGGGYEALVAAHARALSTVSRDIAAALRGSIPASTAAAAPAAGR
jgi:uncharacterized lipoprotein YmbA